MSARTQRSLETVRGSAYAGRALSLLVMATLSAGGAACAGNQKSAEPSALTDVSLRTAPSAEAAASVVPGSIVDVPLDDAPPSATPGTPVATGAPATTLEALEAALKAAADGDRRGAESQLRRLTNDAEAGPYAHYNLGVLAFERGERDAAHRHFNDALHAKPGFGPAVTALVRDKLGAGDVAGAQAIIAAQRQASQNAPGVRAAELFVTLHRGDHAGVIRDTRAVLIDDPGNLEAHYALSMAYLASGRVELADYVLQQALRRDANRADIHYGLGRVAMERGRDDDARRHFEAAIRLSPNYPEANVDLSTLQLKKMEYAGVVSGLEPVVRNVPTYVAAWVNLGSGYKGMRRYAEAKAAFEKALALDERSASAAFNLGILYLDVQKFEELDQLARMEQAMAWFTRYRALVGTVRADDPVNAYERFVREEIQMQEDLARQAAEDAERARRRAEREASGGEGSSGGSDGGSDDGFGGGADDDWDDW